MDFRSPDTATAVFETPACLIGILQNIQERDLFVLQRVSSIFRKILCTTPFVQQKLFDSELDSPVGYYQPGVPSLINYFVLRHLRWLPSLDLSQMNSALFERDSRPNFSAMAANEASWRNQLLTWPPLRDALVEDVLVRQEMYRLPFLQLTCSDLQPDEQARTVLNPGTEGETQTTKVLNVREFPHNKGKLCRGIKVLDLIYAYRQLYLEFHDMLKGIYNLDPDYPHTGEIGLEFDYAEDVGLPLLSLSAAS
jgi:hypothetical protein